MSGQSPPSRAEIVHECERTRLTRVVLPERTVVRKQPLGPGAERRLRHEAAMLAQLAGVEGVAQLAGESPDEDSILLVHAGDTSLAELVTPLAVQPFIGLAVRLTRAVAAMHRRGVTHCDINPGNVVISTGGAPSLVDFALATSFAEIRPEYTHHSRILGTLPYLAPEQTGRTGRPVDQRADLYALGATLYELATGEPPFGTGDPLRLTHDHLARVPVPPARLNPALPRPVSDIIMHLLEKEPDNRYQTADGVLYDLENLPAVIGQHDFPVRLAAPSRLVGRNDELAVLASAFEAALAGKCRAVLVRGPAGVGKTALVDELRPLVNDSDGWFVAGKFDQYRRDLAFDAIHQAMRALGRLLLAEPEDELARLRGRIREAVGVNAGLLTAVLPEFAALLEMPPDPGDPLTALERAQRAVVAALRAVASPERPLVLFVDDLQWTSRPPVGVVDLLLSEEPVDGLFVVAAFRDDDLGATHPLAGPLERWCDQESVRQLHVGNLEERSLGAMVAEMLHVAPGAAAGFAELVEAHTCGNPFETVELLNGLRREGLLTVTNEGWDWDEPAVRAQLALCGVDGLRTGGVGTMSEMTAKMVEAMACLGGRAELTLLSTATAEPTAIVYQALAPAIEDGLLVVEPGLQEAVRFRHDRSRELILGGIDPRRRLDVQLAMARRLAAVPELFAVAAEQYLPVVDEIGDAAERRLVVALLRRAAGQANVIGDYALVNALLTAALQLIDQRETATLVEVYTGRHAARYGLGRFDDADDDYRTIETLCTSAAERPAATAVQVLSLTHRSRLADGIRLGLDALREFGVTVPAPERFSPELDQQFEHLYRWLEQTDPDEDLVRPEITEEKIVAASHLINAVLPATYFVGDHATNAWLSLEALRLWQAHGPGPTLIGAVSHAAFATVTQRGDYDAGYRAAKRALAFGEARGYERDTAQARFLFSTLCCWFEPVEHSVLAGRQAREDLIAKGDLANAGYVWHMVVTCLLDSAPTLDAVVAEVEAGQAFARRTGGEQIGEALDTYRWLAGVLRGEHGRDGDDLVPIEAYASNPLAFVFAHITRALAAAFFGDADGLARHTAPAMVFLPAILGSYPCAVAYLLRGLSLAEQVRSADDAERPALLAELDAVARWLAARAADEPTNFRHLQRLVEAERAWAIGDFQAAVLAFDAARREASRCERPWHRALIAQRAGRFYLAHGIEHAGYELLADARREYRNWGALAKVNQLDWAYPDLLPHQAPALTTGTVDLLGIVSASRALSSETSIDRIHARVVEVLSAMTGATRVQLLLLNGDSRDDGLPTSVLRYVQRTGETLVVDDATRDDRFARDPYFADLDCCSLLAVPILTRAVLLLENHLIRGAFTTERLDGVKLIAGQLAVSLDNAQLYAELTASRARIVAAADEARRRIERDLHDGAQQRLVSLALYLRAAQTELPPDREELAAQLQLAVDEATSALTDLREIARGIHPQILTKGGLRAALNLLASRSPIAVDLDVDTPGRLPSPVEVSAYYVVAEALTNAAKHARASAITVRAEIDGGNVLRISVRDDGIGGADFGRGTGLVGLKDRVEALGGSLALDSPYGGGTALRVELPLP